MRLLLIGAVILCLLAAPTFAVGRGLIDGWLSGEPAPQSVVDDFDSYARQLGFHPRPGEAVLVAQDGEMSLYATTNAEGSYCLLASAPWKRPGKLNEGGTCIPPAFVAAPLIAGLVGASGETLLIAGRIDDRAARTVEFADPEGRAVTRAVGSSGFFIAALSVRHPVCARGDWKPTFTALDAGGAELLRASITLAQAHRQSPGVCGFAAPHP